MSFRSISQDMKGEFGSISRERFQLKMGYGLRSRSQSHHNAQDALLVLDGLKQSCWANLPPELLRDVLMRIEATEDTWPARKQVVACAGVCRSWREIMKEIVKSPGVSAKLTFPISLKQPGPRGSLVQCYIKRNRRNQTYYLYLGLNPSSTDDGKFLLAARKCQRPTHRDYIISLTYDISRGSNTYIGRLRSNFLGTKFTVYDAHPPIWGAKATKSRSPRLVNLKRVSPKMPAGNYPIARVSYDLNVLGSRGPRIMQCAMDAIPASAVEPGGVAPMQTQFIHGRINNSPSISFFRSRSTRIDNVQSLPLSCQDEEMLVLGNKSPRWHQELQCWCLNFNGRVTVASVKNFQLVACPKNGVPGQIQETVILQFGKVGKDLFTMDYQYPISAFEAFAICLSSFDTKIACE